MDSPFIEILYGRGVHYLPATLYIVIRRVKFVDTVVPNIYCLRKKLTELKCNENIVGTEVKRNTCDRV